MLCVLLLYQVHSEILIGLFQITVAREFLRDADLIGNWAMELDCVVVSLVHTCLRCNTNRTLSECTCSIPTSLDSNDEKVDVVIDFDYCRK